MASTSVAVIVTTLRRNNDRLSLVVAIARRLAVTSQSVSMRIVDLVVSTRIFSSGLDLRLAVLRASHGATPAWRRPTARPSRPIGLPRHT